VTGLDGRTFSPHARDRIVMAAVETHSYARAQQMLSVLSGIEISSRQINRLADAAGQELRLQQQQRVALHEQKKLAVEVQNIPALAVVETDGGRIRTRETEYGSGTHHPAWKESKTALFMRMASDTHEQDPAPEPPESLQNRGYVSQLVQQMAGAAAPAAKEDDTSAETVRQTSTTAKYESPQRLMRTCLASIDDSNTFGKLMAAEAHRKGFFLADRRAFVADGMKCNWTIWKKHFQWQGFIPIVDFIHVLSYLYKAAIAIGEDQDFGWGLCADWMRACWQGGVSDVLAELADWLAAQPPLPDDIDEDDPREIVRRSLGYLTNNRQRMNYPQYRRLGLPVNSALMESLIKEMNYRVKGSEKFWNNPAGANHILAVKAAALSEDDRLTPNR
jgi:hypothetical protein